MLVCGVMMSWGIPTVCQFGAGWQCDGNGCEVLGDVWWVHGVSQVRPDWRLSLFWFALLRKEMGTLRVLWLEREDG